MLLRFVRAKRPSARKSNTRAQLGFERLEDRSVPAVVNYTVNTDADTSFDHTDAVTGVPEDKNNMTSLRAVVEYTNNNVITGDWNTNRYEVAFTVGGNLISLTVPLQQLKSNFNFLGGDVTIERPLTSQGQFRLFDIAAGTVSRYFQMTLRNGRIINDGGAIYNRGDLRVEDCTLINNTAGGGGGAIFSANGSKLTITNSTLGLNFAGSAGGAVAIQGALSLNITGSTIIGNSITGAGGLGGGLYIDGVGSTDISNSSFIGNTATGDGGGIYVLNATVAMGGGQLNGNTAGGSGGGIYIDAVDKMVGLTDVSVTQNSAGGKGGGAYVRRGTLGGSLAALTGNTAAGGIPGIGFKKGDAAAPITVPPNQQQVEPDP